MKKLTLLLFLCFPAVLVAEGLPDLGDVSQIVLTPMQERQLGQQSMLQIRNSQQFFDDPEVNDYLNQLGYRLAGNSPEPGSGFEFFAVNDYNVNAFAMPGGYVGVNVGLLLTTQSESELAAVLSHEIAHVTQHHTARLIASTQSSSWESMAALAVAILAARSNSQASAGALASMQARAIQKQLDYTRLHEQEADRAGFEILRKSGFNTHAMPEFLDRLQKATRLLENNAPSYLRTHPVTSERIADIENRVQNQPFLLLPDSLDFQLVRAKLIGAGKTPAQAVVYFRDALGARKFGNPVAQRYGLVSALLRDRQTAAAAQELAVLRKQAKANAMIDALTGQVKRTNGDADTLAFYRTALKSWPQHRALVYDYADLLIQAGQAATAVTLLSEQVLKHPSDVTLYQLQARAYGQINKPLEQHQALAYQYAWQGNLHGAIEQLELAKQAGGSFYQLSTIESDLRELREMMGTGQ